MISSNNSYLAVHRALLAGETTARDLVEHFLNRIEAENPKLNAFLEVFPESAREQAQRVDASVQAGKAGKVAGLVLGVKDNIVYADHRVGASSRILGEFQSLFTATSLQRLVDEGAIVIGRTNCDEFAMGSSNENSAFGPVRHPLDPERVPGGSSGGSSAAVQAGMCMAALGSDTGGSVRQPAAFCDLLGLKPTYGRVSRYGLIAYGSSFDQICPITHNAEDAALMLEVMAGPDPHDNTSAQEPVASYLESLALEEGRRYRIGVLQEPLGMTGLDPDTAAYFQDLRAQLLADGHQVEEASFPYLDYLVPAYYVLTTAEASSNLARFDGIRYGRRTDSTQDLEGIYRRSRSEGFGPEVQRRIALGTFVLSAGYYDAYYSKAQQVRRLLLEDTNKLLERYDFLMSPTTPAPAFKLGDKTADPIQMYLSDIFTVHANLTGHPAVTIPLGRAETPDAIGVQLLGRYFEEGSLLAAADQFLEAYRGQHLTAAV